MPSKPEKGSAGFPVKTDGLLEIKSIEELHALQRYVEQQLSAIRKSKREEAIDLIFRTMSDVGITLADLAAGLGEPVPLSSDPRGTAKKRASSLKRYRNPETGETHSGRGTNPPWLAKAKKEGRADNFLISKDDLPKYNPDMRG